MAGYHVNHQCDYSDCCKDDNSYTIKVDKMCNYVVPMDGEMTFDGNAIDILDSLKVLLGGTAVRLHVSWSVAE